MLFMSFGLLCCFHVIAVLLSVLLSWLVYGLLVLVVLLSLISGLYFFWFSCQIILETCVFRFYIKTYSCVLIYLIDEGFAKII